MNTHTHTHGLSPPRITNLLSSISINTDTHNFDELFESELRTKYHFTSKYFDIENLPNLPFS